MGRATTLEGQRVRYYPLLWEKKKGQCRNGDSGENWEERGAAVLAAGEEGKKNRSKTRFAKVSQKNGRASKEGEGREEHAQGVF